MKIWRRILGILLVNMVLICTLTGCGSTKKMPDTKKEGDAIHSVAIMLPKPSEARACMDDAGQLAVGSYLVARMYLEKLLQYDAEEGNQEEYDALLADTISAFETADILAEAFRNSADYVTMMEAVGAEAYPGKASYARLARVRSNSGLVLAAYAAEDDPPALQWAKEITAIYDNAPSMKGIRTLADQLGMDSKHAYAQLKQAQAILEGAAYTDFADYANTCYKTASTLKTAGTGAGLVISVALAGPATGLAAVAQTGGIVMGGVNTVLEVGALGTILTTNGDGNDYTEFFEKTESQLAPVGQIFSLMSLGLNGQKLLNGEYAKDGAKALADGTYSNYLDGVKNDVFGAVSYLTTSIYDYCDSGSILSGTFTHTDEGLKFTLEDTMLGETEAVGKLMTDAGVPSDIAKQALEKAASSAAIELPELNMISLEQAEQIIENYSGIAPGSDFDPNVYTETLTTECEEILEEVLEEQGLEPAQEESSGITFSSHDGTGILVDPENDIKVMWTHDENGELVLISSDDCEYTMDEEGNLLRDGKPVIVDGEPVIQGSVPDEPGSEEETEPVNIEPAPDATGSEEETEPGQKPTEKNEPALREQMDLLRGSWNMSNTPQIILDVSFDHLLDIYPEYFSIDSETGSLKYDGPLEEGVHAMWIFSFRDEDHMDISNPENGSTTETYRLSHGTAEPQPEMDMSLEGQLEMLTDKWQAETGEIVDFNIAIDAMPEDVWSIDSETGCLKVTASEDIKTLYRFIDKDHIEQIDYRGVVTKFERCTP